MSVSAPIVPIGAASTLSWRYAQLLAGLAVYGASIALLIRAGLGLGPWDAFHVGGSLVTGLPVGAFMVVVGIVVVGLGAALGERPGVGTLANMVLIGVFVDLLLPVLPVASGPILPWVFELAGIAGIGAATGIYIGAGLGKGPRDGFVLALSRRTGGSVRRVRTAVELSVLAAGWAMGADLGIGTVLFALAIGPATQRGLEVFARGVR